MLRKALGDSRTDPRFIETVHGRGYRFIATVNRFSNDGDNGIDALSETSSLLLSMRASRANLTDTQRRAKQKLNDIAKDIHRSQMMELSHNNVLKVNDFHSVWETLFTQMFESNQNLSDFTISSDALHRFQAYEFGRYYHRLIELQREHLSKSKIRIMMLCHKFETDGSDLVKDALAYVRLAMHPEDDISLLRVLNVPPRGIGKTTLDALRESARTNNATLWSTIDTFLAGGAAGRATTPVRAFQELILHLQQALAEREPAEFLRYVLDETGYMGMLRDRNTPEDVARIENLEELTRAVAESMDAGESFTDFLDAAALVSDADSFEDKPGVTLITLHSTKGLEFDHVFLTGMEEGICPHGRSINEEKGVEEERRLVYVGMTRARKTLTLTRAVYRRIFGNEQQLRASQPSRFLTEIPSELVDTATGSMAEIGQTRRYEPDPEYSYSADEFIRRVRGGPAAAQRSSIPRQRSEGSSLGRSSIRRGVEANPMLGRKVRHPEYGVGTIVGVEGDEDDRRLSVSFPGRGTKKFVERYAQLQPA